MSFTAEVITALGGLTGVSTVVASVATLIQARRIHARVSPNHGSSISDATQRIEDQLAAHGETNPTDRDRADQAKRRRAHCPALSRIARP